MARELLEAAADDGRVLGKDPGDRPRDRRQGRPLRPVRHRGAAGADEAPAKAGARPTKAKPRTASLFKDMDLATVDLEDALQAAVAAAGGRRRPRGRRGDHRAERPLRPVPEEGHRLALARDRGAAVRRSPSTRRWRSTPSPSSAAGRPPRRRCASSGNDPVSGKPMVVKDGRFGAVRHRRRDQRDAAQGRRRSRRSRPSAAPSCSPTSGPAGRSRRPRARPPRRRRPKKATAKKATAKKATTKKAAARTTKKA